MTHPQSDHGVRQTDEIMILNNADVKVAVNRSCVIIRFQGTGFQNRCKMIQFYIWCLNAVESNKRAHDGFNLSLCLAIFRFD